MKREKHRAAIALPGAFLLLWGCGRRRSRGREKSGGGNVKILLPETEAQGLAGSGEQREEAAECAEKSGAQLEG